MHPNPAFRLEDRERLRAVVEAHPFALITTIQDGRPRAAHTPVLADPDGAFRFHLARHNPACDAALGSGRALAVFTGPNAYISPDWYGEPNRVPTWSYVAVEAEGAVDPLGEEETTAFLDDVSARFEATLAPKPAWTRAKMSPGRFESMRRGIVAFRLIPDRFEGVLKLSQNKSAEAQARVAEALGPNDPIARLMRGEAE